MPEQLLRQALDPFDDPSDRPDLELAWNNVDLDAETDIRNADSDTRRGRLVRSGGLSESGVRC
jgi:hypothetical protein